MSTPAGRIFAFTQPPGLGPIQDASIRPRKRLAVSFLVVQIGSSTRMRSAVSTSCTDKLPITGVA